MLKQMLKPFARALGIRFSIDHSILINKLRKLDIPCGVVNWIIDFLTNRFQRIKLAEGCFSKWGPVPSGVPQGTKLGLWLVVLMINDLDIKSPLMWIFVDDTTASEVIQKGNTNNAQGITDELIEWSRKNRVVLNPDKCKELRISFSRNPEAFDSVSIDDKEIEVVNSAKLLGITISDNLTWNAHINKLVKKTNKKTILSCGICFSHTKQKLFVERQESKTAIKLQRFTLAKDGETIFVNDMTKVSSPNSLEYNFQYQDIDYPVFDSLTAVVENAVDMEQISCCTKVVFKGNQVEGIGAFKLKKVDCYITD